MHVLVISILMLTIYKKRPFRQKMSALSLPPHMPIVAFNMTIIDLTEAFFGVLLLAALGGLSYYFFWKPAVSKRTFSDPIHCAEILACSSFDNVGNRVKRLTSRAFPNERLVRAFGINNAFTTTDGKYARAFRAAAVEKIKMEDSDWKRIAAFAERLVRGSLSESGPDYLDTSLDSLVQCIALRLALHILFGLDPLELNGGLIKGLAEAINDSWVQSKSAAPDAARLGHNAKMTLKDALTNLFPEFGPGSSPQDNPLNYILPAYETLWRIVLLCFIEVSFRQHRQAETVQWRKILEIFLTYPTQAAFEKSMTSDSGQSVSVSHIVNEGLRLYPPTRRIHRMYHLKGLLCKPEILVADIEKMQRDPGIWNDPLTFKPSRWLKIGEDARSAFMPFGNKPFICPAQKDFGPRMIGVLVAALAAHIDPVGLELRYHEHCATEEPILGDDEKIFTDRDTYEYWRLQRK